MPFFTVNKKIDVVDDGYGRVYVFRMELIDGTVLHKVGMCSSARSTDRLFEVLRSFFNVYRYVPVATIRKDRKCLVPELVEKHMHSALAEYSHNFDKKFDGCSEFFSDIDEEVLLDYIGGYDELDLMKGATSMKTHHYDILCAERKRRELDKPIDAGTDDLTF